MLVKSWRKGGGGSYVFSGLQTTFLFERSDDERHYIYGMPALWCELLWDCRGSIDLSLVREIWGA